jgi:hypothetical protein
MANLNTQTSSFAFRFLNTEDTEIYREFRINSLLSEERRFFTTDSEKEISRTLDEWRAVCTATCDHVIAGIFDGSRLVATMGAELDSKPKTAHYTAGCVDEKYRGHIVDERTHRKAMSVLFDMLDEWSAEHDCERAEYTIRAEKGGWVDAQLKHGSKIISAEQLLFADGAIAPAYRFERPTPKKLVVVNENVFKVA